MLYLENSVLLEMGASFGSSCLSECHCRWLKLTLAELAFLYQETPAGQANDKKNSVTGFLFIRIDCLQAFF